MTCAIASHPTLVLASASPARRQLLISAGITPHIHPSQFDESSIKLPDPIALVERLALSKAETVAVDYAADRLKPENRSSRPTPVIVLGCDSILWMNGEIHGKPTDGEDAIARWQTMRGRTGELITGHALIGINQNQTLVNHQRTQVTFAQVSDRQIRAYVSSGDPLNCAGCFTLEGKGSAFIEKIHGCHSNVLGLSMPLLRDMLAQIGYDITDLWDSAQ